MKKLIIAIIFFANYLNLSVAQETVYVQEARSPQETNEDLRERPTFGIKAGGNLSNMYDSQNEDFVADPKLGFAGGIFINIPLGALLGVQPAVMYSQKGFEGDGRILTNEYSFTRTSHFIDVPILLAIKPASFITILGGPQYSYLLKQENKFNSSLITVEQEEEFDNDDIRKNIFGLTGGVDININNVVLGARAAWDIQQNGDNNDDQLRYKNVLYQATIGLRF